MDDCHNAGADHQIAAVEIAHGITATREMIVFGQVWTLEVQGAGGSGGYMTLS